MSAPAPSRIARTGQVSRVCNTSTRTSGANCAYLKCCHGVPDRDCGRKAIGMAAELILEFEGVTTKEYFAVNEALGIDPDTGEGNWPDGLVAHSAGLNEAGHLVVIEVWDTPEHQAKFMEERLGEALAKGGVTGPPSSVTWIELVAHQHLGS